LAKVVAESAVASREEVVVGDAIARQLPALEAGMIRPESSA
jgi:hypothetical protein